VNELQRWEKDLLADTRDFVLFTCSKLSKETQDELVARIYADVRRTIKLFYGQD
jgi:hypothetical protein